MVGRAEAERDDGGVGGAVNGPELREGLRELQFNFNFKFRFSKNGLTTGARDASRANPHSRTAPIPRRQISKFEI